MAVKSTHSSTPHFLSIAIKMDSKKSYEHLNLRGKVAELIR